MSTAAGGKKRLRGCETCRERHIKCDRREPCSYCAKKGIRCVRSVHWRFRHSYGASVDGRESEFPAEQPWCVVAGKRLAFIDETVETAANHGEGDAEFGRTLSPIRIVLNVRAENARSGSLESPLTQNAATGAATEALGGRGTGHGGAHETDIVSKPPPFPEQNCSIISLFDQSTTSFLPDVVYHHARPRSSGPGSGSPGTRRGADSPRAFAAHVVCPSHASCLGLCEPSSARGGSIFPLRERGEAESMRYYIDEVAPIFDLYDREMSFARSVPEAAGSRPTLARIISTLATKHRESFCSEQPPPVDPDDEEPWCSLCLDRALAAGNRMLDGCALATIVLLRFLVVIQATLGVKSDESKSTEIRRLFETQSQFLLPRGWHQAAFWAGVRQEIYLAILHERSTALCLDRRNIDLSLEDAEDEVWMGRITLHLVDVLEFCFDRREMDAYAVPRYESLAGYSAAWAASAPESFEPLFTRLPESEEEEEVFPEIVFLSDCAMAAWHCYHLARMLLVAHNPRFPRIGSGYTAAMQSMNNEIKSDVQILCGIAETFGNAYRACPPAILGIVLAGDRFTDRREQQALFDFLVRVDKNRAWPTRSIQRDMKEAWGWDLG